MKSQSMRRSVTSSPTRSTRSARSRASKSTRKRVSLHDEHERTIHDRSDGRAAIRARCGPGWSILPRDAEDAHISDVEPDGESDLQAAILGPPDQIHLH